MNPSIDLDRLHAAWQVLDRRVDRHDAQLLQQARRSSVQALRHRLRPLAWGQVTQMLLGLGLVLMAVPVWTTYRELAHVFACGLIVHAYGVATILLGGLTLGRLSRLEYDAPVVALQTRLLRLQTLYVAGSTAVGLAWWLMWIPFAAVVFAWLGVDFIARVAPALPWMIGGGVAGLAATWAFDRWARTRPALHARLRTRMAGPGLTAAAVELESLRTLESGDAADGDHEARSPN
ncbi:hypothetical protein [Cognatilysobacter bugurensis]|uniref:Serine/threonine protein kinase n=1 Tax=Cognatilysobacter bugurensis TaxID=543356 RepID=A0A918SYC2_9GAMM|nr:hypothetical protein [Lysobacter bugurensis]GHA79036.1 hypothetical protein GCM10007067_15590 [Lysobacter bugurensis]